MGPLTCVGPARRLPRSGRRGGPLLGVSCSTLATAPFQPLAASFPRRTEKARLLQQKLEARHPKSYSEAKAAGALLPSESSRHRPCCSWRVCIPIFGRPTIPSGEAHGRRDGLGPCFCEIFAATLLRCSQGSNSCRSCGRAKSTRRRIQRSWPQTRQSQVSPEGSAASAIHGFQLVGVATPSDSPWSCSLCSVRATSAVPG